VQWSGTGAGQSEAHSSQYHGANPIVQFAGEPSVSNVSVSRGDYSVTASVATPQQLPTTGDHWRAEVDHIRERAAYGSKYDGDQTRAVPAGVFASELNESSAATQRAGVEYRGRTTHDDHIRSSTYSTDSHLSIYPNANFKMKKRVPHAKTPYAPSAEFTALGTKGVPFAPNPRYHDGVKDKMLAMQQREFEMEEELHSRKRSPVDAYVESAPNMLVIDENAPITRVNPAEQERVSGKRFIDPEGYQLNRYTPTDSDHLMVSRGAGIGAAPIAVGHKQHRPTEPVRYAAPTIGSEYNQVIARFE
jgi:hypothetical protein